MNRKDFYFTQLVDQVNMNDAFDDVDNALRTLFTDSEVFGIISGLRVPNSPSDVTSVAVEAGVAIDKNGKRVPCAGPTCNLSVDSSSNPTAVTTPEYERWISVFVKSSVSLSEAWTDGHTPPDTGNWKHDESYQIVVKMEAQAPIATGASRPALLTAEVDGGVGILLADYRRIYGSSDIVASFTRTEYAMRGISGMLQSEKAPGTGQPLYRQLGITGTTTKGTHVYARSRLIGEETAGGIAFTQGCHWDDDTEEWVSDGDSPPGNAGAIFLYPDGRVRLCTRACATANDHWGDSIGWTNVFELGSASDYPDEHCIMRVSGGAITVVANGEHSYQRALVEASGMPGFPGGAEHGTSATVSGCCTYPQPFLTPPSSVTLVALPNRSDENVLSVGIDDLVATDAGGAGEIGMRMYASATSADSFVSAIREVRAYI